MSCLQRTLTNLRKNVLFGGRSYSAWLDRSKADADSSLSSSIDTEKLFIDPDVQKLLYDLTGMDLENKVFRERRTGIQQRSHFALMTDERLANTLDKMRDEARHFLHFVPLKEPRAEKVDILSQDSEISGFDTSKFVFTDITFDATDQDRTVVVREVDGTLRTATPEEHDRMNRTYYEKSNRPVFPPPLFTDPYLQDALDRDEHEFVLDWACWFYEPDDPSFVKLSQTIYDRVALDRKFDVLHSTRHFGPMVFYFALNGNIPPLLNHFGGQGRLRDCANLIRLQKTLHPNWRVSISSSDSDQKIVNDFLKENKRFHDDLVDLLAFMRNGTLKVKDRKQQVEEADVAPGNTSVHSKNVTTSDGPLGDLSEEFPVKVARAESSNEDEKPKNDNRSRRFKGKTDKKR